MVICVTMLSRQDCGISKLNHAFFPFLFSGVPVDFPRTKVVGEKLRTTTEERRRKDGPVRARGG